MLHVTMKQWHRLLESSIFTVGAVGFLNLPLFFPNEMEKQDPSLFLKFGHPCIQFLCSQFIYEKPPVI